MEGFQEYPWEISYRTAGTKSDGSPVNILHDFYIPALQRAMKYDRMAGYFRSTSLAAASEGYTAFLQHGGKMRLIVGADMAVQDVEAILAGDQERFSERLLSELDETETWPSEVVNGVSLLAQMVSTGRLEVKVAFRKHGETGRAIAADSTEDGYVHEKWFIMEDEDGNHIRGSGSLNESKTALMLNAENIDVNCDWEGRREKQRVQESQDTFNRLWKNTDKHLEVLSLPQAVKEHLVTLRNLRGEPTEIDGTQLNRILQLHTSEPSLEELLKFAVLKDAPKMPGGIYIGMYSAPVAPWPHQEMVSRRLVESWPYSYMMCDEVGLGKTIEAALAIRSLILSGRARRVLVSAPASLTSQWQHELAEKAMLSFELSKPKAGRPGVISHSRIVPSEEEYLDNNLYQPDFNIVSTGLVSRKERQATLQHAKPADIILVDEAHYARRSNPRQGYDGVPQYGKLYQCIDKNLRTKAKSLWMATATPMQIDPVEVYDLLKQTKRVGPFCQDAYLTQAYFEVLGKLVHKDIEKITRMEWEVLGRSFAQLRASDPYLLKVLDKTVVDSKNRRVLRELGKAGLQHTADARYLLKPLFSASPLSRVMMRHTRKLLEQYQQRGILTSNLAKRHILPLAIIKFTQEEADFYVDLQAYCDGLMKQIKKNKPDSKQMIVFLLNFLQLRFASSIYAITKTLERRLNRVELSLKVGGKNFESQEDLDEYLEAMQDENDADEDDIDDITIDVLLKDRSLDDLKWEKERLDRMLVQLRRIHSVPSKIQHLLNILSDRYKGAKDNTKQTVIFTRFFDSLTSIKKYIDTRAPGMHVGVYSGKQTCWYDGGAHRYVNASRDEIKHLFLSGRISILLCTDAAAEGLNLQTADLLINFDLGWNPMKIEQRIGRIDRIGQKYSDISVLNMCYLGSTEEIVYGRLVKRLNAATQVVGAQQISMLPIEPNEFRDLQNGTLSEEELTKIARDRLQQQRRATEKMELDAKSQFEIYQKEHQEMAQRKYPAKVEDIWSTIEQSEYLKANGMEISITEEGNTIRIPAINDWDGLCGTNNRESASDKIPFLTWGQRDLDGLLACMAEKLERYKNCIKRVSIPVNHWEVVGYVVATISGAVLVTSFETAKSLQIEQRDLTEEEIQVATQTLKKLADQESNLYANIETVEKVNADFADVQKKLVQAVGIALLEDKERNGFESYTAALKELESHPRMTYAIELPDELGTRRESSLFTINSAGGTARVVATGILTQSALSLCRQVSSQLRISKKKQTCRNVIDALKRMK